MTAKIVDKAQKGKKSLKINGKSSWMIRKRQGTCKGDTLEPWEDFVEGRKPKREKGSGILEEIKKGLKDDDRVHPNFQNFSSSYDVFSIVLFCI